MSKQQTWPRIIALVDMDAFFASIEQLDHAEWRNQPVAVTNGTTGTCIITCSYEARSCGIHTGMRLKEARVICPRLIQAPSRPHRYAMISTNIMNALKNLTPDIEIFSVDEAFLDFSHCRRLYQSPKKLVQLIKETIFSASELHCSVGLSGDKTTAKFAAKQNKPNGSCIIEPNQAKKALQNITVDQLCGINHGVTRFLSQHGVVTCGDMEKLPIAILAKRFGNIGRRFWYMCQGQDPEPVHTTIKTAKSMGHGKILPKDSNHELILRYFMHLAEKLAARLRQQKMMASHFFIGMRARDWGWIGEKQHTEIQTDDGKIIYALCKNFFQNNKEYSPIRQLQLSALNPIAYAQQFDLFSEEDESQTQLNETIDRINERFGDASLKKAKLITQDELTPVISPAWRPTGHRSYINPHVAR